MNKIRAILRNVPWLYRSHGWLRNAYQAILSSTSPFLRAFPPGHYHSALPDMDDLLRREEQIFKTGARTCAAVDLREEQQLTLLDKFVLYYRDLPFPEHPERERRYFYENGVFSYADAIVLHAMLRHFRPKKVIEIGSGFSSAAMLDTDEIFLKNSIDFVFIEPFPERLHSLLRPQDRIRCTFVEKWLQDVEVDLFDHLEANDILFIDSSHVLKAGSDVAFILFEILPRLKREVIVHIHDILWPFEYPKEWFLAGYAWNEAYAVRAFLQYNGAFEILYFNSFVGKIHHESLARKMPLCMKNIGGSLWLKKAL
jgi:hypothetical protein